MAGGHHPFRSSRFRLSSPRARRLPVAAVAARRRSVEVDTTLSVETNSAESVFHLRIGPRRQVEVVRVADNFYAEVDQKAVWPASG